MTSCKGNIIEEVLKCITLCEQHKRTMENMRGDPATMRECAVDHFKDMESRLCEMAAMFLAAPMSGRLFTPLPHESLNEEQLQQSLEAQMR
jgi:hypothetical protein